MDKETYDMLENELHVGTEHRIMGYNEREYNKKYQIRRGGVETRPIFDNCQRVGKQFIFYLEERHMIGAFTITLLHLQQDGYIGNARSTHKMLEEIGNLLALCDVGWKWYDHTHEPLNTKAQGNGKEKNPPGFMGPTMEDMFGYRSDDPTRDINRLNELFSMVFKKMDMLKEIFD